MARLGSRRMVAAGRTASRFAVALAIGLETAIVLAQAPHYPGAWLDQPAMAQESAAGQRGVTGVAVYGSNDRIERVENFYRQFLQELPAIGGSRGARFCLDRVERPDDCRRFVETWEAGGGSRIRSYQTR